ncbi:MAG: copper resistance system multicopper oxidase [Metallibacterium scheffleri]|jgi:CopA family copper-resistance protein|uniref:copper resistance system multicopper oxidase n=1 Tax=Metallibacterium scheffleri TaxID=993689 RepID=UPI0026E955AF|nr:copper resistance system multicopper oxidase [Metallibacterium scheffleri]MCK9367304.1 copper resistance system multicopper oxidase [Metallibacterium scheffleri]
MSRILVQSNGPAVPDPARRRFVQGLALGGAALGVGLLPRFALAAPAATAYPAVLSGTEFDLTIGTMAVDFTGHARSAIVVNRQLPAPILRWREGDTVTLRVRNTLPVTSSIHWHGILLPFRMDGVPGLSFPGIAPGETFTYRFPVRQTGTYWYHSHSGFQEQQGLYGPIVVEARDGAGIRADRDYVVMLSDWTDQNPDTILATLKRQSDYYNFHQPTALDFMRDVERMGIRAALARRRMWNRMRMNPTDLSDVSAYTYTYLLNGTAPAGNWTALFKPGERVRLRVINGSAMTYFDLRIPGLKMTVVSSDGQDVEPVTVDELRIGVAETYDVIVEPGDGAYTIFAESMDRSGYARGTLAPHAGMQASVPPLDPVPWLSMNDMMGAMGGMAGMAHGAHGGGMQGMNDKKGMAGMSDMAHAGHAAASAQESASPFAFPPPWHCRTGPSVDMCVTDPRTNLDDPGVGLRDNGRRVLSYADLHTIGGPLDPREPGRTLTLHLTGNMQRYVWGFDGVKFSDAKPIVFRYGERLRVTLINDTMMTHPIHLHGMWSEVEAPDGAFQVRKHTVSVQPAQQISYLVSADALGRWAYHCHLLYHMEAGMFREVIVA